MWCDSDGAARMAPPRIVSKHAVLSSLLLAFLSKGSRNVFVGQVVFGRPGVPRQKTPYLLRKIMVFWPCRLRRQGQQTIILLNKYGFWALVPQASTNTWPKKHYGIPVILGAHQLCDEVPHATDVYLPRRACEQELWTVGCVHGLCPNRNLHLE